VPPKGGLACLQNAKQIDNRARGLGEVKKVFRVYSGRILKGKSKGGKKHR